MQFIIYNIFIIVNFIKKYLINSAINEYIIFRPLEFHFENHLEKVIIVHEILNSMLVIIFKSI